MIDFQYTVLSACLVIRAQDMAYICANIPLSDVVDIATTADRLKGLPNVMSGC